MSLTSCPDCGGKVSTSARTCPHCGRPSDAAPQPSGYGVPQFPAPGYRPGYAPGPYAPAGAAGYAAAYAAAPEPPQEKECPSCRVRHATRGVCGECELRMVPVSHLPPHRFPRVPVYFAGFGPRLGALLIDTVVLLPVIALGYWVQTRSPLGAVVGAVLALVLTNGYEIGLTATLGQTLGKRVMDIQVRKADGAEVGWGTAFLRRLPIVVSGVIATLAVVSAAATLTQADFDGTYGFFARVAMITRSQPAWAVIVNGLMSFYYLADDIVFLANRRHRALHDIIAGTVVVHV